MTDLQTGVSYFANRWMHHYARDLDDMLESGVTFVVHTFSEDDFIFTRAQMARIFEATRNAGLGVWADPWGVMGIFGGEAFSAYVARFPDDCQILTTGQRAPAACPTAEGTLKWMRFWVDAAVEAGADTLFWDEPHWFIPGWDGSKFAPNDAWGCFCPRCQDAFQQRFGHDMPGEFTPEILEHRQSLMLDFLGEMTTYVASKGARNAICLLPEDDNSRIGLPFGKVAALPDLDIFGADPYGRMYFREVDSFVEEQTRRVVAACESHDVQPMIWAQGYGLPAGSEGEIEIALRAAVNSGAKVIATWGYRGCAPYQLAAECPDDAWAMVGRTYRTLRSEVAVQVP